ncbi:MAG: DUF302 domain-containing protein [Gammaproteobacteria bacterium]|nr:DUF302 domain-containing protein [Gammaproteobacteria bacterium]
MNVDEDIVSRKYQIVDFDDLIDDLVVEIQQHNFHISRINHIDNIYDRLEAGIDVIVNFKHYKIVEICNLNICSELISADLRAGVFMPVRFIVYQRQEETSAHVAFLKPTAFARLFDSKPLMQVATQLEEEMIDVLEEMAY